MSLSQDVAARGRSGAHINSESGAWTQSDQWRGDGGGSGEGGKKGKTNSSRSQLVRLSTLPLNLRSNASYFVYAESFVVGLIRYKATGGYDSEGPAHPSQRRKKKQGGNVGKSNYLLTSQYIYFFLFQLKIIAHGWFKI